MAFITNIEKPNGRQGLAMYVRVGTLQANKNKTVVVMEVWDNEADRKEFPNSPVFTTMRDFVTANDPNEGVIDYGYLLLQASGEFPDAQWNI